MSRGDVEAFMNGLPSGVDRVLVPIALIVGGLIVARLAAALVRRIVRGLGKRRWDTTEQALVGIGVQAPVADVGARLAFWAVFLLALSEASRQAQLGVLTELIENATQIAPLVALGMGIVFLGALAGVHLGRMGGALADRSGAMPGTLAAGLIRASIVIGAAVVAFDTVGLATVLPVTVISLLLAALLALAAAALTLASRGVLGNIAAARYVEETFIEGERVLFRQEPAEVQSIGLLATELITDAGALLRVPNQLLVQEVA